MADAGSETPDAPPESLRDLGEVLLTLRARLASIPQGYITGKTAMRDTLVDAYGVSMVVAEELIDQLEARGFIRYPGETKRGLDERQPWLLEQTTAGDG